MIQTKLLILVAAILVVKILVKITLFVLLSEGKDQTMYILVKKEINLEVIEKSDVVIQIKSDGKHFVVIKHRYFSSLNEEYHISDLKHILTAGRSIT